MPPSPPIPLRPWLLMRSLNMLQRGNMTTIEISEQAARTAVRRLQAAFDARTGLLSEIDDLVENQIPPGVSPLSREHALFLFFTVANDHGVKSRLLYERAKALFSEHPEFF